MIIMYYTKICVYDMYEYDIHVYDNDLYIMIYMYIHILTNETQKQAGLGHLKRAVRGPALLCAVAV